jgi:hypothetical protein
MVKLRIVADQDVGEKVGIIQSNLDELDAKDGDWVGIKYENKNNGKVEKADAMIKRVVPEANWKPNLIKIYAPVQKKLKLPDEIQSSRPNSPSNYEVEVWKHDWPRDLKFYGAILTAVITILAAGFGAYSESLPDNAELKILFGIASLVVIFIGAIAACISTIMQRQ